MIPSLMASVLKACGTLWFSSYAPAVPYQPPQCPRPATKPFLLRLHHSLWDLSSQPPRLQINPVYAQTTAHSASPCWDSNCQKWKQPKCPPTGEWTGEMWSTHAMEWNSATERNEVLGYATTWMNPENMTLWESCRPRRPTRCVIPCM